MGLTCQYCFDEMEVAEHEETCKMNPANAKNEEKKPKSKTGAATLRQVGKYGMIPVLQKRVLEMRNEVLKLKNRTELVESVVKSICSVVEVIGIEDLYSLSFSELRTELEKYDASAEAIERDNRFIRTFTLRVMKGYTKAILTEQNRARKAAAAGSDEPESPSKSPNRAGRRKSVFSSARKKMTKISGRSTSITALGGISLSPKRESMSLSRSLSPRGSLMARNNSRTNLGMSMGSPRGPKVMSKSVPAGLTAKGRMVYK